MYLSTFATPSSHEPTPITWLRCCLHPHFGASQMNGHGDSSQSMFVVIRELGVNWTKGPCFLNNTFNIKNASHTPVFGYVDVISCYVDVILQCFFWCQPFWKMRFTWMHDDRCSSTRLQRVVKCSMFWKRRHDWIVWFNYGFKVCLDMFGVSITWKLHSEYQLWGCDLLLQDMQTAKQFCYLRYPQALQIHWRIRCTYFTWRDITRYACNMFRCSFLQHTLASDRMEPFFARW